MEIVNSQNLIVNSPLSYWNLVFDQENILLDDVWRYWEKLHVDQY